LIDSLTRHYGRLMLDIQGVKLSQGERNILTNPHVGGVILFSRNIESRQQVQMLVSEIRACKSSLLVAVDQEGGRVQRLLNGFTSLPPMQLLGDLVESDKNKGLALIREVGWLMASEVLACDMDISFAPVLDIDRSTSTIIGDRAFSDDPDVVVLCGKAFVEGMREAGMSATGKHFPGHGGIAADSHLEAPVDYRDLPELEHRDLVPFREMSTCLGGIMPAHITFPEIDSSAVGFSSHWLQDVLREEFGFDGVIFSDDLSMKGADIVGGYVDKARHALDAGCDMILVCNNPIAATQVLEFMQDEEISMSDRVGSMRALKAVSWDELERSPRRAKVVNKLGELQ